MLKNTRLIPRKELGIEDKFDRVLDGTADADTLIQTPREVVDKKLQEQGYTEDDFLKEERLSLVHKLSLRGANTKQIAEVINVSLAEVLELKKELKKRITEQLKQEDPMSLVAESVAFYDESLGDAMRVLDNVKKTNRTNDMVRVLEIALKARSEKDKFLVNTGILNNNQQTVHVEEDEYVEQAKEVRNLVSDIIDLKDFNLEQQ